MNVLLLFLVLSLLYFCCLLDPESRQCFCRSWSRHQIQVIPERGGRGRGGEGGGEREGGRGRGGEGGGEREEGRGSGGAYNYTQSYSSQYLLIHN